MFFSIDTNRLNSTSHGLSNLNVDTTEAASSRGKSFDQNCFEETNIIKFKGTFGNGRDLLGK